MPKKRAGSAPLVRIFVRIGALRRFHALTKKTEDLPVEVKWDRRRAERDGAAAPTSSEPDRRSKPPYTWEVADFVVVEDSLPESKAPAKKR